MKKVLFLACCGIGLTTAALAQEKSKTDNAADLKPAMYSTEAPSNKEMTEKKEESKKSATSVEASNAEKAFIQLGLTDEQMGQMSELSKRIGEKANAINNNPNLTTEQKEAKLTELKGLKEKRQKEILGDALFAKYTELMKPKKSE
jgi:hypothetical protein